MRINNIAVAPVLALSCALFAASCVPSSESSGVGGAPAIDTAAEGDFGGDPAGDIDAEPLLEWSEPGNSAEPEGWFAYRICVLLKEGPKTARVAFCNSQPSSRVRARCFSHLNDGPTSWQGWCYNEFSDE